MIINILKKATKYYELALEAATTAGDNDGCAWALEGLGIIARDAEEYEKALVYFELGLAIAEKADNSSFLLINSPCRP